MNYQFAEFTIQGYVGKVFAQEGFIKVNLGASKSWKDRQSGEWLSKTKWNTVTIFKNTRGFDWLKENLKAGDLVHVRGEMENNSYEKDGVTVYDVTFAADQVSVIPTERNRDANSNAGASQQQGNGEPVVDDEIPY